jgi:hypothetical protein
VVQVMEVVYEKAEIIVMIMLQFAILSTIKGISRFPSFIIVIGLYRVQS